MSYIVLARKYRPPNFDALVGQEHVVQALSNALTQQRLHHAYLFTGTRGVGKTTVSRILAKSLNCTGPDGSGGITAHPCGVCPACRDIDGGRFIDYVELDAASNRGVDEISQLLDQAVYKPVVGRFKVYMIDEVHMLSTHAFNAMLKTLEEPPDYLKFVLATTDPQKVPPTVLSRCLQFNLRPMAPGTVQQHLGAVLAKEHIGADAGALRLLARAARGSMRDALSLTDQAIAFGAGSLSEAGVREMLGAVDRGHAVRIVQALAASDGASLVATSDALRALGLSAAGTLEELAGLLQQMAVLQAVPDAADAEDPDAPEAARLAVQLAPDETQLLYSIALHGRAELGLAPDEYSGLVMVLLRMLAFRPAHGSPAARSEGSPQRTPAMRATPALTAALAPAPAPAYASVPLPAATSALAPAFLEPATVAVAMAHEKDRAPAAVKSTAVSPRAAALPSVAPTAAVTTTALRRSPSLDEPPPWLDAPFEDEAPDARPPVRARESDTAIWSAPVGTLGRLGSAAFEPSALGARWAALAGDLVAAGSISAFVRELAMQSQCTAFDATADPVVVGLRVERENLRAEANCDKLQAALSGLLGRTVRLRAEPGVVVDSPAKREAAERLRRQAEAEQIIHDDPLVRALMAQYETARIVPGSIKPH